MSSFVTFAGKTHVQPGVYSDVRVQKTVGKNSIVPEIVAIIGTSEGGEPQVPLRFSDPNQARDALRDGNLLRACEFAWAPAGDQQGANEIVAIRVTPAEKGTLDLDDAASSAVMTISSRDWGEWTNNIRFKIEDGSRLIDSGWSALLNDNTDINSSDTVITYDTGVGTRPPNGIILMGTEFIQYTGVTGTSTAGTLTGCKRGIYLARGGAAASHLDNATITLIDLPGTVKVTVENQLDPGVFETFNNLGEAMDLLYTGSGSAAVVTVTVTSGAAVTIAATVTGASSDNFSIDLTLGQYNTLQKVANAIDALANWSASLKCPSNTASSELDKLAGVEAKLDSSYPLKLMRIGGAMVSALEDSQYVEAEKINSPSTAPANLAYTSFSTGDDGTEDASAWTDALAALAPERDVLIVVPATGDVSFQSLAMAHVVERLTIDGLRQRMFAGSEVDDTVQNAIDAATTFASRRAGYFYPGIKRSDSAGEAQTYGGWAVAAMAAGLTVGVARRRSIANIPLLVGGVEQKLTNGEMDSLILAGVCPTHSISGQGTFIRKAVTTQATGEEFWHQQTNVTITDFILGDLESDLNATYIEQLINAQLLEGIRASTVAKLQSYAEEGLLFQNDENKAFKNVRVRSEGSIVRVDFEAAVAQPADFILLTAYFTEGASSAA